MSYLVIGQQMWGEFFSHNQSASIMDMVEAYYKDKFQPDSKKQHRTVYNGIRDSCLKAQNELGVEIETMIQEGTFESTMRRITIEQPHRVEKYLSSKEATDYEIALMEEVDRKEITNEAFQWIMNTNAPLAVWYEDRAIELAKEGKVLTTVTGGRNAVYEFKGWFEIAKKNEAIARRFHRGAMAPLLRMGRQRQVTQAGREVAPLLEQMKSTTAYLENGSAWQCRNCNAWTPNNQYNCSFCKTSK